MPSYEYRCKKCSHKFELLRRIAARDDATVCPNCKSKTPKRVEIQRIAVLRGTRPNAAMGEGEAEDFLDDDGDDDAGHGHSHGPGGHTHDHHGGVDDWGDDDF